MELGELVGRGRSADVYDVGDGWVLRRYRDGLDATGEGALMRYAAEHGYPVPELAETADGGQRRTDLVMRRVAGPSLRDALRAGTVAPAEAGGILAALLHRLHALPPRDPDYPADRVLHLDLHPDNVMLGPEGPVVIDWCNAADGPPGHDWATSALLLAMVSLLGEAADVSADTEYGPAEAVAARTVLDALLAGRGGAAVALDDPAVGDLGYVLGLRQADRGLRPTEKALLGRAAELVAARATAAG